jgi:hypothetical protein
MLSLPPGRWAISVVAGVAAVLSAQCGARPTGSAPGLSYVLTTIDERQGLNLPPRIDTTVVTGQFAGDNVRREFVRVPARFARDTDSVSRLLGSARGEFMVGRRGSSVTTVIDPLRKQYFHVDMAAVAMRSLANSPQSVIHPGDTVFTVRVTPDTTLDGMRAEHWRVTDNHTVTEAIASSEVLATERRTIDEYAIPGLADVPGQDLGTLPHQPLAGYAYSREARSARAQVPPGLHVLTILRSVSVWGVERSQIVETSTQRISNIRHDDISLDVFAVPAGYARVAAPTLLVLR